VLKERDIDSLSKDLEIAQEEAKAYLIRFNGDINKVIEHFLQDFKFHKN
jgi:hypothetical protein